MGEVEPAEVDRVFETIEDLDAAVAGIEPEQARHVARANRPRQQRLAVETGRDRDRECPGKGQPQSLVGDRDLAVDPPGLCLPRRLRGRRIGDESVERFGRLAVANLDAGDGRERCRHPVGNEPVGPHAAGNAVEVRPADDGVVAIATFDPVAVEVLVDRAGAALLGDDERQLEVANAGGRAARRNHRRRSIGRGRVGPQEVGAGVEPAEVHHLPTGGDERAPRVEDVDEHARLQGGLRRHHERGAPRAGCGNAKLRPLLRQRLLDRQREGLLLLAVGPVGERQAERELRAAELEGLADRVAENGVDRSVAERARGEIDPGGRRHHAGRGVGGIGRGDPAVALVGDDPQL